MKKDGDTESTIISRPSKYILVYALHSLEYVLGLARFRVFVPNLFIILYVFSVCFKCVITPALVKLGRRVVKYNCSIFINFVFIKTTK